VKQNVGKEGRRKKQEENSKRNFEEIRQKIKNQGGFLLPSNTFPIPFPFISP